VIAAYNAAATIGRAIESAIQQTLPPEEIIVVDDASIDNTREVVLAQADHHPRSRIRLLGTPCNSGPGAARNIGWDQASSKYIAFLDADDRWHPLKLEIQHRWMEAHPEAVLTGHPCVVRPDGIGQIGPGAPNATEIRPAALLRSNRASTPSIMLRRSVQQRFDPKKRFAEDYLLWLRIVLSGGRAYFLDAPLAYLGKARYGAGGLSAQLWNMEKGVLNAYRQLRRERLISSGVYALLVPYSLLKFIRRVIISKLRAA
jgi:glycosyltransferase involved in cell wall biosynthesis